MSQHEQRNRARGMAVEAAQAWIDQYDDHQGSIVTGYVLIVECVRLGRPHAITWMTGNGSPPRGALSDRELHDGSSGDIEQGPLPAWRVRGMCGDIVAQLDGREAEIQRRNMNDE